MRINFIITKTATMLQYVVKNASTKLHIVALGR